MPEFLQGLLAVELTDREDVLARYLFQKGHFRADRDEVRFQAFMPPPDFKLSTFHINRLSESDILQIGRSVLAETVRQDATLYGHAELRVEFVRAQKLKAIRDDDPQRHTNVVGWPDDPMDKSTVKNIAQELASKAQLRLLPIPLTK